jgi:FOG: EAL domain
MILGTGYNSLVQLVTLPISNLKIDKFFIDRIEHENDQAVIREVIRLAHSLRMEVIAEGVETERQLQLLEEMGCDNIQGYYFSKPLSEKEYIQFVANYPQS